MGMLASCDHQVMLLVMHPPGHNADEPEGLELSGITLRDANFEYRASLHVRGSELPSCVAVHGRSMCCDHSPNRADNGAGSCNDVSDTTFERFGLDFRRQRDVAHVDQMLAQSIDIHLGPIGARVRFQYLHNLLNGRKGILSRLRRFLDHLVLRRMAALLHHHVVLMIHWH